MKPAERVGHDNEKGVGVASWPITVEDVAAYIGPMSDPDRVADATAASVSYVESRRSDLSRRVV